MIAVLATVEHEWAYTLAAYGAVVGALLLLTLWTVLRGRQVGKQLPPEERRWM